MFNNIEEIMGYLKRAKCNHFVAQKYIENPLIIQNKKFDIR